MSMASKIRKDEGQVIRVNGLAPWISGFAVVLSLVVSKYFQIPLLFIIIVILAAIFYQMETNRKNKRTDNFEETLINLAKFIIVTGILGYALMRIAGLFLPEFV